MDQRERLIPMTMSQYGEWEVIAREARRAYVAGHITAEEFLRRIDTAHELESYDTVKQELPPEESVWQRRVAGNPDFDSLREYPATMMVLELRGGKAAPQWQMLTREELVQGDQKGHRSLREEYGGGDGSKK